MISNTTISAKYTVTAGVLQFSIPFRIYKTTDVSVFWSADGKSDTNLTLGTDYSISIGSEGGTVTLVANKVPVGSILAIEPNFTATQETDLSSTTAISTTALETQLDKQTQLILQVERRTSRAVILPATSSESPQEVVQSIYASRDSAAASANAASAQSTAAQNSAQDAAHSADTAAQTVQTATTEAVNAATAQANNAHDSALAAAQSAAYAAAASSGLAPRMDAVEAKNATQDNRLNSIEQSVTATPGASKVPISQGTGKLAIGWIPGIFVGDIRLVPFRAADLAANCPGWVYCNGDQYLLTSAVGMALNALPANFKADWGITLSGSYISIPKLFYSDGRGFYVRAVNGTARQVGSVATDKFQGHTHGAVGGANDAFPGPPYWRQSSSYNGQQPSYTDRYGTDGSNGTPRTGAETSVLDIGMTPAIFLNV